MLKEYLDRQPRIVRQFVKFGVTGSVGALVDFGTLFLLLRVFDWHTIYFVFGFEIIAANMVSVFLAIVSNFTLNKFWTFRDTRTDIVVSQSIGYFLLNLFTWTLNQLLTSYFTFRVPLFEDIFGDQRIFAAKVAAVGFILVVNFLGSKFLVFRSSSTNPSDAPLSSTSRT